MDRDGQTFGNCKLDRTLDLKSTRIPALPAPHNNISKGKMVNRRVDSIVEPVSHHAGLVIGRKWTSGSYNLIHG